MKDEEEKRLLKVVDEDDDRGRMMLVVYVFVSALISACLVGSYILWRFAPW